MALSITGRSPTPSTRRSAHLPPSRPVSAPLPFLARSAHHPVRWAWQLHIERMLSSSGGVGIDLVMHPGDLSYATGYESEWDRFMAMIEPIASRVPYMTGQGNHERDFPLSGSTIGKGDSGGECGVPTQARFHMPTCAQPNTAPCVGSPAREHSKLQLPPGHAHKRMSAPVGSADDGWYSFNQGPVHFAVMNTELSSRFGSRQHGVCSSPRRDASRPPPKPPRV